MELLQNSRQLKPSKKVLSCSPSSSPKIIHIDNHFANTKSTVDIFYAASFGLLEELKKFVQVEKVDVNIKGEDDATPLHWAALKNHLEVRRCFLPFSLVVASKVSLR